VSGSPLGFVLFGFKYCKLPRDNGGSPHIGLYKSAVGGNAGSFAQLFNLVQDERRVVFARSSRDIGLSNCFFYDGIHGLFGYGCFRWDGVGKQQARLYLKRVLCICCM
jgi:hypothetical protein